jgi:hypothetical protein
MTTAFFSPSSAVTTLASKSSSTPSADRSTKYPAMDTPMGGVIKTREKPIFKLLMATSDFCLFIRKKHSTPPDKMQEQPPKKSHAMG